MRRQDARVYEIQRARMKRPKFRERGLGRLLADKAIAEARRIGYSEMLVLSLPSPGNGLSLYRSLGFREIPPHRYNPDPNAVFMQLALTVNSG